VKYFQICRQVRRVTPRTSPIIAAAQTSATIARLAVVRP
jgi:hypothetical protein